ncbi:MAG: hypothetical protein ACP5JV_06130 [Thermus sp.]|uniref:hypothetical protein n=1 Tax=Thermus sp. TaxID=275 RepID=UPI003D0BC5DE
MAVVLAQFGPLPGQIGPGPSVAPRELYQNPALGMRFPVPAGFQKMEEMPYEGGMVVAFFHPTLRAELYAISHPFQGDLQSFHQYNLQRLAQMDQQLQMQGIQLSRQPLSGLNLGGRPALGVYSQITFQGQSYVDVAVYTVERGRAYGLQLTAPAQAFPQVQGVYQALLSQVELVGAQAPQPFPSPQPFSPFPQPTPPPFPPVQGEDRGGSSPFSPQPFPSPQPPSGDKGNQRPRPAFTPPADRPVELRYGKEVGDGTRFAVALGGLRYRIVPKGPGRWEVTEVVAGADGEEKETYPLDGLGLQEEEEVLLPPVWHTGREEIGGLRFSRENRGDLVVYRYQDEEIRLEFAYRKDGWLAYYVQCDLTKKANPCVRYTLKEVR